MDHITAHTMRRLVAAGFRFPDYEGFLDYGMVYNHQNDDYYIGGYSRTPFDKEMQLVVDEGIWLPDSEQLLSWLQLTGFNVSVNIDVTSREYSVVATDLHNNLMYCAKAFSLVECLANVILKICKSNKRTYLPESILRLEID